jgi:cytochrome c oxidase cbb3-type subunit 3
MKKISLISILLLTGFSSFADANPALPPAPPEPTIGLSASELLIVALLLFAVVGLIAMVALLNALKVMVKERNDPQPYKKYEAPALLDYEDWIKAEKNKPTIWTKLLSLKPIEEEQELIIPHAYDEIHELNNPVPRWFNVLFYGTMIFAVGYLYYYHVADGPKQDQEYAAEMEKAELDKKAFLAKSSEKYDENSVKIDAALIENGKSVFNANCVACHGDAGQGVVGPNLTDEYWLHGGSINDVFKTVKYGVPAKGMASWEKNLSAKNIAEVVNYILSLQGSKPANAKAPQGDKYEQSTEVDTVKNESIAKK